MLANSETNKQENVRFDTLAVVVVMVVIAAEAV